MHTFDTPGPLSVIVDLSVGRVRILASARTETVVDLQPSHPSRDADVRDAEQTWVELTNSQLTIKVPKRFTLFGRGSSVDVTVHLPEGSDVQVTAAIADVHGSGRLGSCRLKLAMGAVQLETSGALQVNTGMGAVTVDRVGGTADVVTGSGAVRIGAIDGRAEIKNSNGHTWVGSAGGDLRARAANGDVAVDRADASVQAKSANGDIRVLGVARGSVSAETAAGAVEIGIRDGSAAWLDVSTSYGRVSSSLTAADAPGPVGDTVEVRARTQHGDILVRRS